MSGIIREYLVDPTGREERIAIRARDEASGLTIGCGLVHLDALIKILARRGKIWAQRQAREANRG